MSTVDIFTGSMKMKTLDLCWAGLIQFIEFAVAIKSGQKNKEARLSFDLNRDNIYHINTIFVLQS